jgi:hypothetical protein
MFLSPRPAPICSRDQAFPRPAMFPNAGSVAPLQLDFSSWYGAVHFNLRPVRAGLDFPSPGWGTFYKRQIFEPGAPQIENACGFFRRHFEMIVEITTVIFLIQGVSILSRVIGRRGDVLYYVSNPNPR